MNDKGLERNKWLIILIVSVVIVAVVVGIILINKRGSNKDNKNQQVITNTKNYTEQADGTKVNTSGELSKTKIVENITIEKSELVYKNGTSKLTSKVTNNGVAKENLRFKIKFIANDGTTISESVGFLGAIKENEIKYIDSSITFDVLNAKDITYEIMD